MMGRLNHDQGQFFYSFRLDEAVPDDHLVRQIAATLDLSWVHSELAPFYPEERWRQSRNRAVPGSRSYLVGAEVMMQRIPIFAVMALMLCALMCGAADAQTARPGGYTIRSETCGRAPFAFPRLRIGLRDGYCAGMVASTEDGLQFPRSIIQIPGHDLFVVADMGGWVRSKGRLLLLDPSLPSGRRTKVLLDGIDYPFGLAIGADKKIYSSTTETIFRFEPLAAEPARTVETIVQGLPARNIRLPDGSTIGESVHLMKQFVFDATGRLYVNVGAPTDACVTKGTTAKGCAAGEGPAPMAAVWAFTPPAGGVFPTLKPSDPNPPRKFTHAGSETRWLWRCILAFPQRVSHSCRAKMPAIFRIR